MKVMKVKLRTITVDESLLILYLNVSFHIHEATNFWAYVSIFGVIIFVQSLK